MSLKSAVLSTITAHLSGESRLQKSRKRAETRRVKLGRGHLVEYFHQVDDPYSHLAVQALLKFSRLYPVSISPHLVGPPAAWAAPERGMLVNYARVDAARLSRVSGLSFTDPGRQPDIHQTSDAAALLAGALDAADWLERAVAVGDALWTGQPMPEGRRGDFESARKSGEARRHSLGHFMSAMIHYGGEWYWGLDRLHYLETRLCDLGLDYSGTAGVPIFELPAVPSGGGIRTGAELHWYLSFRSPYTYISSDRVRALAEAYGAQLKLRFVLPMVMRGLPVPRMKQIYFMLDAAREAKRAGVPFGKIADPLGKPVERGYSLLPWARENDRGFEFVQCFMRAVWSEGVDAGTDEGLRRIVERAGLDWNVARTILGNDDWRAEAEANRAEMVQLGLWGVPCVRIGETAVWGQDRLWVAEDTLKALSDTGRDHYQDGGNHERHI